MEDVNWLIMDLLPSLCDKVNGMHSNSIKGGDFLDKQFLKKISASRTNYYFESFASYSSNVRLRVTIISILFLHVILYPIDN